MTTLIFTGPSLPPDEAKKQIPEAWIMPPVQCGDIIKSLRLNPSRLVIIDGYFENVGAVWHKEILLAISQGIPVFGASSMGALRAAELSPFGMIGHGRIFNWYQEGVIIDDDEVTVSHDAHFQSDNTPMVNVRTTVEALLHQKRMSIEVSEALLKLTKAQPYPIRNVFHVAREHFPDLEALLREHYIDQKRLDALSLLERLETLAAPTQNLDLPPSYFFDRIHREMVSHPWSPSAISHLPECESRWYEVLQTPWLSQLSLYLAKLLHLLSDLNKLPESLSDEARLQQLHTWCQQQSTALSFNLQKARSFLKTYFLTLIHTQTEKPTKPPSESFEKTLDIFSQLYYGLLSHMHGKHLHPSEAFTQHTVDQFRLQHGLADPESTYAWMRQHAIEDMETFIQFAQVITPLKLLLEEHKVQLIGVTNQMGRINWPNLALTAAGF